MFRIPAFMFRGTLLQVAFQENKKESHNFRELPFSGTTLKNDYTLVLQVAIRRGGTPFIWA